MAHAQAMREAPVLTMPGVDRIEEEAASWGVGRLAVRLALLVPPLGLLLTGALGVVWRAPFRALAGEDRIYEWVQFAAYATACVAAVLVARVMWRRGRKLEAGLFAVFGAALFFITGEEISWGQRIFGWETPEKLASRNHQNESNIHNIRSVQDTLNMIFTVIGLYGSAVVLFFRWSRDRARRLPAWFDAALPPMFLSSAFFTVFLYKLSRWTLFPEARFVVVKTGEWVELCLAVSFAVFGLATLRRLKRERAASA